MRHDTMGEVNHDVALMRANAAYQIQRLDRSNVVPRNGGMLPVRTFRSDAPTESQSVQHGED